MNRELQPSFNPFFYIMESPEEPNKPPDSPPEEQPSSTFKMKLAGIKVKLILTVTFLIAGFLAWELVSVRIGHNENNQRWKQMMNNNKAVVIPISDPQEDSRRNNNNSFRDAETKEFTLSVAQCSIPYVPIRGKVLEKFWYNQHFPNCLEQEEISTFSDRGELEIFNISRFSSCCYREIIRPEESEVDGYRTAQHCEPYAKKAKLPEYEFFLTECTLANSHPTMQYRFHANVPISTKKVVRDKVQHWENVPEKPISIAMIVLDSVSRTHSFRSLPRTMNLLLANMGFEDFKGHHILGEPTMPNALPLLLGASSHEEFWKIQKPSWTSQWDGYPFIWKKFSHLNYVTMFAEDMPRMGTFNYGGQQGFRVAPTDYYPRPLFLAHKEGTLASMSKQDFCFGNQTVPEFLLNYHFKFLKRLQSTPTFSVNWMARPQHDTMEGLPTLDPPLFNFFRQLSIQKSLLENTLLIVTGDHGFWDNSYSNTHEGLIERRLPLLLIRLPENLLKKHPEFRTNLQNNAHRITSHHDTYQTLIHLAQLVAASSDSNKKNRMKKRKKVLTTSDKFRMSLLEPIPLTRTCLDANIPAQVCACNLPLPADDVLEEKVPEELQLPPVIPNALPFIN